MNGARTLTLITCVFLGLSCSGPSGELGGFACDNGRCLAGFECHPELFVCVPEVSVGCDGSSLCPSEVATGDSCTEELAFVPCVDGLQNCDGGCRTCTDGRWGACSEATCILGQPFSCAACDDDCSQSVLNASPVCSNAGATGRCDYVGACQGESRDADGIRSNGCECVPGSQELCDGVDNDCDGEVDEGFTTGDPCGEGLCAGGNTECSANGMAVICSTGPGGSADATDVERCDGIDNDCNGQADEVFDCRGGESSFCDPGGGQIGLILCDPLTCVLEPCSTAFGAQRPIAFDRSGTSLRLNDFPVLVRLDDSNVNPALLSTSGEDVRFFDEGRFLSHELALWDPSGVSELWVEVPQLLSNSASDTIELLYDGRLADAPTVDAEETWSSFVAVHHFDEGFAGTSPGQVYGDSSGNGFDAPDTISSIPVTGVSGNAVEPGTGEFLTLPTGLVGTGPFALSLWLDAQEERPLFLREVTLSVPTPEADAVVLVELSGANFDFSRARFDGADLDVVDRNGSPLDYWVERWTVDHALVWVELPTAGTQSFVLTYGRGGDVSRSDPASTLRSGVLHYAWGTDGSVSNNASEMAERFSALAYDGALGSAAGASTECVDGGCTPGSDQTNSYAVQFEGWLLTSPAGTYDIAIDTEETGEIWLGSTDYLNPGADGILVTGAYGTRSGETGADAEGTVVLPGITRVLVRGEEDGSGTSKLFFGRRFPATGSYFVPAANQFLHAPRYTPELTATVGIEELVAVDLEVGPIRLAVADGIAWLEYSATQFRTPLTPGFHFFAVNYDSSAQSVTFFVDGDRVTQLDAPGATVSPLDTVRIGHLSGSTLSPPSRFDELRVSETIRSEEWLQATYLSVMGGLVSYP